MMPEHVLYRCHQELMSCPKGERRVQHRGMAFGFE